MRVVYTRVVYVALTLYYVFPRAQHFTRDTGLCIKNWESVHQAKVRFLET